ncbi:MAG: 5-formyltetrahydrofolate cyclo-ligase, partial [Pseudomonadota bacterium]|nr:5-formyltetrahydrofolate cyclo-ligase [Pseudomonadota bacterium]
MGGSDGGKVSGKGSEPEDKPPGITGIRGYSSPPCMLHELDPAFMEHPGRDEALARQPAAGAMQDWEDVRLWRKAKRAVLI